MPLPPRPAACIRPRNLRTALTAATSLAVLSLAAPAMAAARDGATGIYVQGGQSIGHGGGTDTLFLGVMLPRDRGAPESSVTSYWDLFYGQWRGPQASGATRSFNQLGATVVWRKHFDDNRSAWFGEGGLGISLLDGDYSIPDGRVFGSRFTFNGRLGLGRSFGERAAHELSLNYQHFSNGGLKKPNPGLDLIQLRYAYRF